MRTAERKSINTTERTGECGAYVRQTSDHACDCRQFAKDRPDVCSCGHSQGVHDVAAH